MRTIVKALAAAVRRAPWVVVAVTVVISLVLGYFSGEFQPAEDQNEAFAPDAPELVAAERINELFGSEATQSIMQVIVRDDSGNAFSVDALNAMAAIRETVLTGAFSEYLLPQGEQGPVLHYLAPVEIAIAQGAPPPADDASLQRLYLQALSDLPPEQGGFARGLLPASADADTPAADSGLLLIFTSGPASNDDFDQFVEASGEAGAEIRETDLPDGITVEPFSFELLFSDQDEFQTEIGRLFATAGFIILLVLSIIFLVRPRTGRDRLLTVGGFIVLGAAILVLLAPGLATLFPSVFPEAWADVELGVVLLAAVGLYALVYLTWTFARHGLRRTTADTMLTIVAIFMAISWMNGYGYLRFGDAGQLSQILPILLIGLGVDYSIHWNSRYREEIAEGQTVPRATTVAVRTVGVALVLATITTAVGFLTNITNDIPELREFGELAAFGIVASFLLMLTFLPAVRQILDRRADNRGRLERDAIRGGQSRRLPRLIGRAAWLPKRAGVAVVLVSLLLGVAGAYGTTNLEARFSFLDFVPTTSPLRATFETLLDEYGGGFGESTQVLIEGDATTGEAWNALVEATGNLADTPNVALFGEAAAAQSPVSVVGELTTPDTPTFDQAVAAAAGAIGLDPATFLVPADADVTPLYAALETADPASAGQVITADRRAVLFTIQTNAGEDRAAALQADLNDDFGPVVDAGLTATATSDEIISDVIISTLRSSQVSSLLLTLTAALVLLVANFWWESRRPLLGLITTIPVVLVVLWSFSIMVLFNIPFGPVTATISALAIGIGIPYMIHVTHRYQEDRVRYETEQIAIEETLTHTGGALAGSALTTIAGFGILVTSTTIPFRQFGFVTAYTILLALIAAIVVLPSYLYVWDQFHRRKGDAQIHELDPVFTET